MRVGRTNPDGTHADAYVEANSFLYVALTAIGAPNSRGLRSVASNVRSGSPNRGKNYTLICRSFW
jgi:hypothetical protein